MLEARGVCGVSAQAQAVLLSVTVSEAAAAGALELKVPEAGLSGPVAVPFLAGETLTVSGHYVLSPQGAVAIKNGASGAVRVTVDVVGYFE